MKIFRPVLIIIVAICSFNLLAQGNAETSFDQTEFVTAFKKVLVSYDNYYSDIITDVEVKTEYGTESKVNVDFPGAELVTYGYEEYEDPVIGGYYVMEYITAFYYNGSDARFAGELFRNIKQALKYCQQNQIEGTWTSSEKSETNGGTQTDKFMLENPQFSDLVITLQGKYSDSINDIQLIFETESWDY